MADDAPKPLRILGQLVLNEVIQIVESRLAGFTEFGHDSHKFGKR